ncbi:MAG: glycosyltransferase family 9 protein [Candidatus Eisenbacteria bacterium]|uniref:Glycosyltransferase family 9 protein n=1 Tax=Eiseniibacteriota bacterium TaxID=2212470 RepID=A0A849SL22_UNCEI|nr:glycosyltransferase family 9 protein [Candidatus Eisenbacteria bacterium]
MSFRTVAAAGAGPLLTTLLRASRPDEAAVRAFADPERVKRVLVIKLHDQLGDFLVATPAVRALRRRYPNARLVLLTREFLRPLAERNRDLDQVVSLPRIEDAASLARFVQAVRVTATFRPELTFVMNSVSRSKSADGFAALSRAGCVVGRSRVGDGPVPDAEPLPVLRDPVYDLDVPVARGSTHQTARLLDLVRWCGADAGPDLVLELDPSERLVARTRFEELWRACAPVDASPGPAGARVRWIGIHPGAANPLKCWPLDRFVQLGAALVGDAPAAGLERPHEARRLIVFDAPRERGRAAAVHVGLLARGVRVAFAPAGSIGDFAAACSALDLLICNDSGVAHIASALRVPSVSFHALGDPAEWGPQHDRAVTFYAPRAIEALELEPAISAAERLLASG